MPPSQTQSFPSIIPETNASGAEGSATISAAVANMKSSPTTLYPSLVQEGTNFKGRAQILNTPMGKIASSLISEGVTLGVSSRGIGSLREDHTGAKVVGEDFMLATAADIVADPSAPDAFVHGIMEGKEWVWEGGHLREQIASQTKKRINTLVSQKRLEEHKLSLFNDFLSNL